MPDTEVEILPYVDVAPPPDLGLMFPLRSVEEVENMGKLMANENVRMEVIVQMIERKNYVRDIILDEALNGYTFSVTHMHKFDCKKRRWAEKSPVLVALRGECLSGTIDMYSY